MERPTFPLPARKYLVTGDRDVTTVLTVHPADKNGNQRGELSDGATLHDVTHLGCRSARYTPVKTSGACSPANAPTRGFPVNPGAAMPAVNGCQKQDYTTFAHLETAFERQRQFTADAAHELRTPLAIMISETQTALARPRCADEYRETVEGCLDTSQQMRRLTESLLT